MSKTQTFDSFASLARQWAALYGTAEPPRSTMLDSWDTVVKTTDSKDAGRVFVWINTDTVRPLAGTEGDLFRTPGEIGAALNMPPGRVQAAILALALKGFVTKIKPDGSIAA